MAESVSLRWVLQQGPGGACPDVDGVHLCHYLSIRGVKVRRASVFGVDTEVPLALLPQLFALHPNCLRDWRTSFPVPSGLEGQVACVYRPAPVAYHGYSARPPITDRYHLSLEGMCEALGVRSCHREGWTGEGIRIAIPDTGCARHPWFEQGGYALERVSTIAGMDPARDEQGHGTVACALACTVAPGATIIAVRQGDYAVTALETALAQRPQVVSVSWGWDRDYTSLAALREGNPNFYRELQDMRRVICAGLEQGVSMIFAGGNGEHAFPASLPEVIAVGGMTLREDGGLEASTLAGSFESALFPGRTVPDLCGLVGEGGTYPRRGHIMVPTPRGAVLEGENMPTGTSRQGWALSSGSSAAAPQIAGVVALMRQANSTLRPEEIKAILCGTARGLASPQTGAGLVDAGAACRAALRPGTG